MKQEAESNADSDRTEKEKIDKINQADSMIFQTEKQIKEFGEKIPADNKAKLESALSELKTAHSNKDVDAIDNSLKNLNEVWSKVSTEMYEQSSQPSAETEPKTDSATDIPFEEVKS